MAPATWGWKLIPLTDDPVDRQTEAKAERPSGSRHREESADTADYYTPMSSISRTRNKADSWDRTRSKSRSKTVRLDRHTGQQARKTAVDTDDSSSDTEPFTTAKRSVEKSTDRRSVSFSKHRGDPVGRKMSDGPDLHRCRS